MSQASTNYNDKVIPIWLMVYDQDPTKTYLFANKNKVFASVEGLVRSVVPDEIADELVALTITTLEKTWGAPFIPMMFHNTQIFVHRLEIDKYNPIHKVLTMCKEALKSGFDKQQAIDRIDGLLVDPVVLSK